MFHRIGYVCLLIPLGSGLSVGSRVKPTLLPNVTCPRVLEFRQLIQFKPLTLDQRQQMVKAIQAYSDYLEKRQTGLDYLLPRDPRNESEKLVAEELEDKVREYLNCCGYFSGGFFEISRTDFTQVFKKKRNGECSRSRLSIGTLFISGFLQYYDD